MIAFQKITKLTHGFGEVIEITIKYILAFGLSSAEKQLLEIILKEHGQVQAEGTASLKLHFICAFNTSKDASKQ